MGAGNPRSLLYPSHPFGERCVYDGKVSVRLSAGDTFILFPGVELQYQADKEEPWEYCWAGFMGTDAASIIRNTGFSKELPYILKGKIPDEKIRNGLEGIYRNKEIRMSLRWQ